MFLAKKRGRLEAVVVESMRLKKGESLRICTDGEKIYVDRFEEPTL
jgi:hypothetical protein